MTKHIITDIKAQKILDYLQRQPYNQVYQLIPMIMNLPTEEPAKPKKADKPEHNS